MQVRKTAKLLSAVMAVSIVSAASAATLTYDTSASGGFTTGAGTWNFGSSAVWTTDGTTLQTWSDNANVASFGAPASSVTVSIDGSSGQVGAAGLVFTGGGTDKILSLLPVAADSIQLGSSGITASFTNQRVVIGAPVALTGSQTWTSSSLRAKNAGPAVALNGTVSSLSGSTNLTLDGKGISSAAAIGDNDMRVVFGFGGTNTYSGTVTLTGGAGLWLDYASNGGSKLDDNSALVLAGGSVFLSGGTNVVEVVGSTTLQSGANSVFRGASGGGTVNRLALGVITHQVGATLDITNSAAGVASTSTKNTAGMIGGWATNNTRFAAGSVDGSETVITNIPGSSRATPDLWGANENVRVTGGGVLASDKTVNSLLLLTAAPADVVLTERTVTVTSGGILVASPGVSLTGGRITTGAVTSGTGELFVHTVSDLAIGSEIADNGSTPTALVKTSAGKLTLTGNSSYTGETYLNAGTLVVDGSLANSNIIITAGSLTGTGLLNFNIVGDSSDLISIQGGSVSPSGLDLNLVTSGTQTMSEYVLADNAAGFAVGQTFASLTLNGGPAASWAIDYDGTLANPGRVVLVVPEPGTIALLVGVVSLGLMRRQRRHLV